jgi:TPR repeat
MPPSFHKEASRILTGKNIATFKTFYLYLLALVLVAPSLVWILLDTSAWGGDQSQYGFATLELFHTLTTAPLEWPRRMLDVFVYKPNGLIWLGQVFLPLAFFISSINIALLLTAVALQGVTLILIYRSVRVLTPVTLAVPTTACLVVASAPLFISFAHYYLVENFQIASVAWFVLIMSLAPTWNRSLLFAQLIAATGVALAAKEIQPLFCVWPGAVACIYLLRSSHRPDVSPAQKRLTIVSWTVALPMAALTAAWYFHNLATVYGHLKEGAYGQGVKTLWGKEDTYLNTLVYWVHTAREVTFLPGLAELSLLIAVGAVVLYVARVKRAPTHFSLCAGVAALQIVTILMVFSLSPTRVPRYLLPALPYVALLIGWSLAQVNRGWITALGFAAFATQFVLLHGEGLNLLPAVSRFVEPVRQLAGTSHVLDSLVARTCPDSNPRPIWNIIAIEPSIPEIGGDWLAPEPANYVVAKRRFRQGGALPCHYGYYGEGFFGSEVLQAWESMLARRTEYVVVVDPAKYSTPGQVFNQALSRENFPRLLRTLETSELFTQETPLVQDTGILIFHKVEGALTLFDYITRGRELSDRGLHEQAVADLQKATVLGPSNAEAWANLAFAYERAGQLKEAISAGVRARQLSPRHYYVNLGLARVSFKLEAWSDVVSYARAAASDAPSTTDQANAWALAARGAFRSGDSKGGCDFLRRGGLTLIDKKDPEASSHTCAK